MPSTPVQNLTTWWKANAASQTVHKATAHEIRIALTSTTGEVLPVIEAYDGDKFTVGKALALLLYHTRKPNSLGHLTENGFVQFLYIFGSQIAPDLAFYLDSNKSRADQTHAWPHVVVFAWDVIGDPQVDDEHTHFLLQHAKTKGDNFFHNVNFHHPNRETLPNRIDLLREYKSLLEERNDENQTPLDPIQNQYHHEAFLLAAIDPARAVTNTYIHEAFPEIHRMANANPALPNAGLSQEDLKWAALWKASTDRNQLENWGVSAQTISDALSARHCPERIRRPSPGTTEDVPFMNKVYEVTSEHIREKGIKRISAVWTSNTTVILKVTRDDKWTKFLLPILCENSGLTVYHCTNSAGSANLRDIDQVARGEILNDLKHRDWASFTIHLDMLLETRSGTYSKMVEIAKAASTLLEFELNTKKNRRANDTLAKWKPMYQRHLQPNGYTIQPETLVKIL